MNIKVTIPSYVTDFENPWLHNSRPVWYSPQKGWWRFSQFGLYIYIFTLRLLIKRLSSDPCRDWKAEKPKCEISRESSSYKEALHTSPSARLPLTSKQYEWKGCNWDVLQSTVEFLYWKPFPGGLSGPRIYSHDAVFLDQRCYWGGTIKIDPLRHWWAYIAWNFSKNVELQTR